MKPTMAKYEPTHAAKMDFNGKERINPCHLAKLFMKEHYSSPDEGDNELAKTNAGRLRYYDGNFYVRRPGVWVKKTKEELRLEVTSFLQVIAPHLTGRIANVLLNIKALCNLSVDSTPPLPFHLKHTKRAVLAFKNGLLDLTALAKGKTAKLLPHHANWFSTSILPYEFDPEATLPTFKAFLAQILDADPRTLRPITKGDNRIRVVQEVMGYCLLPDNRYQRFFVLPGKGWNGKGTLLHVLQHLIGAENISSVSLEAMGRTFGTWSLVGKMVNLCGDMNDIDAVKEGTLKTWTGEDLVTVERKHLPAIQVEPTIKFVYACNELPQFKDTTNGTWRRMMVIPFNYGLTSDEEADPQPRPKLREELPGILNFALEGLSRLLEQGHFSLCEVCTAAAEKHREACIPNDPVVEGNGIFASDHKGKPKGSKSLTAANATKLHAEEHDEHDRRHIARIVCHDSCGTMLQIDVPFGDLKAATLKEKDDIEPKKGKR